MGDEIRSELRDQIGVVHINRPHVLNALNQAALTELAARLAAFDEQPEVKCLLITGDEQAFAAGVDVAELLETSPIEMVQRGLLAPWDRINALQKPVIAAVQGYALGSGCELALACDLVVAADTARFGLPQLALGIIPGCGGTQRLTRLVGRARALDLILTGRVLTAAEALALGLVSRVVPPENCLDTAFEVARAVSERPPLAVRFAKAAVRKAAELPFSAGLEYERQLYYQLFGSADQREGMRAFLEKRPPVFVGR